MTSLETTEPAGSAGHRPDLVGATIAGKYVVKRCIGIGGMGSVYEGEHIEIGKRVAIKVIDAEHAKSGELAARLRREARAASAVESEHIVQVFDVGQDPAAGLYMVMELLNGEDLSTYLERVGGKLPLEEGAVIVVQAARGLAKAHAAGVVHRDLKPANLFLTRREDDTICVKVVDFGISKLSRPDDAAPQTLTREGSVVGTPVYMSPEQAQGLQVDVRTDVWALGALAYEVFAGRPPYEMRATYEQMIIQIVTQPIPKLAEIAPWIPGEVQRVIEGALQHDVNQRTADAATFGRDLSDAANVTGNVGPSSSQRIPAFRATGEAVPTAPGPPTATGVVHDLTDPVRGPGPKKRVAPIVVGVIVLLLAGFAAFALIPRRASPSPVAATVVTRATSAAPSATPPPAASLTADPPPVASAEPTASSASSAVGRRPLPRPAKMPATAAPASAVPAPAPAGQYGAAGVSTAY